MNENYTKNDFETPFSTRAQPFDMAQDRPFDMAQDRPFDRLRANELDGAFDVTRNRPFDVTQNRPFDRLRTGLERFKVISRR